MPPDSRRLSRPLLLTALASAAACSSSDPTGPGMGAVAGTYALRSVGGAALPAAVVATSVVTSAQTVTRTLNADGTCQETGAYVSTTRGGTAPTTLAFTGTMTCRWSLNGRTVTFEVTGADDPTRYAGVTTATYADDGTLTEAGGSPNGQHVYPRVYGR